MKLQILIHQHHPRERLTILLHVCSSPHFLVTPAQLLFAWHLDLPSLFREMCLTDCSCGSTQWGTSPWQKAGLGIIQSHHAYSLYTNQDRKQLTLYPVADLQEVPWVPWNPSFEGLPFKILYATLYAHTWATQKLQSSNNKCVSPQ